MSNEFDLLKHEQASHEADSNDVAHKPGKYANTDFAGTGQMGPLPPVPGKRSATEGLPFDGNGPRADAKAGKNVQADANGKQKNETASGGGAKSKSAPTAQGDQDLSAGPQINGGKETKGGKDGKDAAAAGKAAGKGAANGKHAKADGKDGAANPNGKNAANPNGDAVDAGGKDKTTAPLYHGKQPAPADAVNVSAPPTVVAPTLDVPKVSKQVSEKWVKETGRTPEQHHDQIVAALGELTTEAQTAQTELMTLSDTLQQRVSKDVADRVNGFTSSVTAPGRSRVFAAYTGMYKTVEDSAQGALTQVATHKTTGKAQIATQLPAKKDELKKKITAAKTTVKATVDKNVPAAVAGIQQYAGQIPQLIQEHKAKAVETGKTAAQPYRPEAGDAAQGLQSAEVSLKNDVWQKQLTAYGKQVGKDYESKLKPIADDVKGSAESMVRGAIADTATELDLVLDIHDKGHEATLDKAANDSEAKVDAQEATAKKAIGDAKLASFKKIESERTAALEAADKAGKDLGDNANAAGQELANKIKSKAAEDAKAYAAVTADLQASLKKGGPKKFEDVQPQIADARAHLAKMREEHKEGLNQLATTGTADLATSLGKQKTEYETAIKDREDAAKKVEVDIRKDVAKGAVDMGTAIGATANGVTDTVKTEVAKIDTALAGFHQVADAALANFTTKVGGLVQEKIAASQKAFDEANVPEKFVKAVEKNIDKELESKKSALSKDARTLRDAMDGWGTDENKIYGVLRKCSYGEIEYLEAVYDDHFNWRAKDGKRPLRYDLTDELNDSEQKIAFGYLDHNRSEAIKLEIKDSSHWYNDDEARIEEVLRSCSDEEIHGLNTDAEAKQVVIDVRANLHGCDRDVMDSLLDESMKKEDREIKANAIRVFDAMEGPGTDEAKMKQILENTTDPEDRKKLRAQFNAYAASKGWDQGTGGVDEAGNTDDALTRAIKGDTSDGERSVMLALAAEKRDENLLKAAKLYEAADGVGTNEAQMFEALDDEGYAELWEKSTPEQRIELEKNRKKQINDNLTKLDANYKDVDGLIEGETTKAPWTWGEILAGKKEDGTAIDSASIKAKMVGDTNDYAPYLEYLVAQRKLQTGRAEPELMLAYAFWNTPGTDEDTVFKILGNEPKPRSAIWGDGGIVKKFKDCWGVDLHKTDELAAMDPAMPSPEGVLSDELGGKDWMKVRILMCGQPENAKQMDYIAQLRHKQATSGKIGGAFMWVAEKVGATDERTTESKTMDRWNDTYKKDFKDKGLEDKKFSDIDPNDVNTLASVTQLKRLSEYVEQDTEAYAAAVSTIVDAVVTALELIGGVLVSFATMGAASPMLAAFIANMIIQGTLITLKAAVLGDQYGWGDFGADALKAIGTSGFAALGEAKALGKLTEHVGEFVASKMFVVAEKGVEQGGGLLVKHGGGYAIKIGEKGMERIQHMIAAGTKNIIISSGQEVYNTLTNEKTYEGKLGDVVWGENSLGKRLLTNAPRAFAEGFVKQWIDEVAGTSNLDNNGRLRKPLDNALSNMLSDMGGTAAGFFVYVDNYGDAEHFWHEFFKQEANKAFSGFASGYAMHKARAKKMGRDFITNPAFGPEQLEEHWHILAPEERQQLAEFVMKYGDEAAKAKLPEQYKSLVKGATKPEAKNDNAGTDAANKKTQETHNPAPQHADDEAAKKNNTQTTPEEEAKKQQPEHQQQNEAEEAKKAAAKKQADEQEQAQKKKAADDERKRLEAEQQAAKDKEAAEKAEAAKSQKKEAHGDEETEAKKAQQKAEQDAAVKKQINEELGEEDLLGDFEGQSVADPEAQARRAVRTKKQASEEERESEQEERDDAREARDEKKRNKRDKKEARREENRAKDQAKKAAKEQERLLDLATEAHKKYAGQIEEAKALLKEIVPEELGEVMGRAKEPESAANRLERAKAMSKKPIVTVEDAIDNIWDALGTRVVLKSTKPEDIAQVMKALTKAIEAGKIEVVKAASNHGEGVAPILTQGDLDRINSASGGTADTENGVKTAPKDKSAFTAGLLFVKYPNGTRGEIQLIGKAMLEVANAEHIPYDLSIGKPLARGVEGPHLEEMKTVTAPVEAAYAALAKDPAKKAAYEQYMRDLYKYAIEVDQGNTEAHPPKLPDGIDQRLSKEGLEATVKKCEEIKAKAKAEKLAQEQAQAKAATTEKPNESHESDDGAIKAGPKKQEKGAAWSEDEAQTKKPAAESEEEAISRRSQPLKSSKGSNEEWAEPGKRMGVPDEVALTRQELHDFVKTKYAATLEKYITGEKTNNKEFLPFLEEMAAIKETDPAKRKDAADAIVKKMIAKSQELGVGDGDLRTLYNVVEKDDLKVWQQKIAHLPKEQQAKLAHMWRQELRILTREMMTDNNAKELLYQRDLIASGDRRAGTFDMMVDAKKTAKKLENDEQAWDDIIKSATKSNDKINKAATGSETGMADEAADRIRAQAVDPKEKLAQIRAEREGNPVRVGPEKKPVVDEEQAKQQKPAVVADEEQAKQQKPVVAADQTAAETKKVVRAAQNPEEQKDAQTLAKSMDVLETELGPGIQKKLVPPPSDKPVLQQSPSDALIGLPTDAIEPTAKAEQALAAFKEKGIPRWPGLTENERAHETQFANEVEQNLEHYVNEFYARSQKGEMFEFEVDGAKKLYAAYGTSKEAKDLTPEQLKVRATANHALHPTAVAIARLAFLKRLDQMQPGEQVFVTNGGCGGGKGSLTGLANQALPKAKFGAVWDAAGEGDAMENLWVLKAAQQRGLKVTYGFVENEPMDNYKNVLKRADGTGRIVDPITYARSYVRGQKNMKEFLASKEYQDALAKDPEAVQAIGINFRQKMADKDNPNAGLLGKNGGKITAEDIPDAPDEAIVTDAAIKDFKKWIEAKKAAGDPNADLWMEGAGTNALKFKPGQEVAEEPAQVAKKQGPDEGPDKGPGPNKNELDPTAAHDADEPARVSFTTKGDKLGEVAAKIPPEAGYFDVVVHGDAQNFYVLVNGKFVPVKANTLRTWLKKQPGYDGQPIRLISCETGANAHGIAQSIANGMGVKVIAPTDAVWVHKDGHLTIGPTSKENTGKWAEFEAGVKPPAKVAGAKEESTPVAAAHQNDQDAVPAGKQPAAKVTPHPSEQRDTGEHALVGVGGSEVPTVIPRMRNLPEAQADAEERFAQAYEQDGGKALSEEYLKRVMSKDIERDKEGKPIGDGKTFATDQAKVLSPDYNPEGLSPADTMAARGKMNLAVHQTANAVAKQAFVMRLDQIQTEQPGGLVLVTAGGVGAGKSYSIKKNPDASALKSRAAVVWDSAGEQNSTELKWVVAEAKKRGLEVAIVYVHRRPEQSWENMQFGVIPRAANEEGRMVDARLHAESYAIGAKNFDKLQREIEANGDTSVKTIVIDATGKEPQKVDHLPDDALNLDADAVHARNVEFLKKQQGLPEHVIAGGNEIGEKVWGPAKKQGAADEEQQAKGKAEDEGAVRAGPSKHEQGQQKQQQEEEQRKALVAEVGSIPVARIAAGTQVQGETGPLHQDTYYLTREDGGRMLIALAQLGVQTRAFNKGFIVRRGDAEWYFEFHEAPSKLGEKAAPQTRDEHGLPAPNAAIVEIYGFRGARTKMENGVPRKLSKEEQDDMKAIEPLSWAGHIGISVDGGKTIWGFTPKAPPEATVDGKDDFSKTVADLLLHKAYPGQFADDTEVFRRAEKLASMGYNTKITTAVELVDAPKKLEVIENIKKMSGVKPGEHGFGYSFPLEAPKDGEHYEGTQEFPASNIRNCATFPEKLGVPIPEPSGNLREYMPALEKWAQEDGPKDFRTQEGKPEDKK